MFFAGVLLLFSLRIPLSAETVDRVVAKVNGDIITLSSVYDRFRVISEKMNTAANIDQLSQENELMKNALTSIIEEKLQVQEAKKNGLEVSEESINKALDDIKKNNEISDQQFEAMLQNEGRSIEAYRKVIRDQILVARIVGINTAKNSVVTKKQIKKYYSQHQKDYWEPPKVKARHILFIVEKDASKKYIELKKSIANKILHQIRAGTDFAELARKYSEDVTARLGGDVGVIKQGMMVPEFEEAAFRLKAGEVSDVVTTKYGFHIIKSDEIFPGYSVPLNQVKEEIRNLLRFQNKQKVYQKWIKELKKNAFIEISLFEDRHDTFTKNDNLPKSKIAGLNEDKSEHDSKLNRIRKTEKSSIDQQELTEDKNFRNYQDIAKNFKYFKRMRDSKKISELEYREMKKELLKSF